MHRRLRSVLSLAVLALAFMPSAANADCAAVPLQSPDRPADVRGITFEGTVVGVREHDPRRFHETYVFEVHRVWAGDVGRTYEVVTQPCYLIEFEVGSRYLFSWNPDFTGMWPRANGGPDPFPNEEGSVGWEVEDNGEMRLLQFGAELRHYAAMWRDATEMDAALALVAPGVTGRLPDTGSRSAEPASTTPLAALALAVATVLVFIGFRRRLASTSGEASGRTSPEEA